MSKNNSINYIIHNYVAITNIYEQFEQQDIVFKIEHWEIWPLAATWMDLEIIVLSKVSQKEEIQISNTYDITYMGNLKWHKWTYLWNRNKLTDIEKRLVIAKGEGG